MSQQGQDGLDGLGQVREILFGEQARDAARRVDELEARIAGDLDTLREAFAEETRDLRQLLEREMTGLRAQLDTERSAREHADDTLRSALESAESDLGTRIADAEARGVRALEALRTEFERRVAELTSGLDDVRQKKLDTQHLKSLLQRVTEGLNEES